MASTLKVRVEGLLWEEVPNFFRSQGDAQVYIVRHDDEGNATVTFGDGVRGSRLLTGVNNVTATYRHGAGSAAPPSGSITQMVKPVKGVTSVHNPVPAYGGGDAESLNDMRRHAPSSALTLGRAVSLHDIKATAAGVAGVRAVKVDWTWHDRRQRPIALIWYIGDSGIEERVAETVRSISDPSTPIDVIASTPIPLHLSITVKVDRRYVAEDVLEGVRNVLTNTDTGILAPENIGIGTPLIRSRIFQQVLSVEGTVAVRSLQFHREDPPSLRTAGWYWRMVNRLAATLQAQTALEVPEANILLAPAGGPVILTGVIPGGFEGGVVTVLHLRELSHKI